MFLKLTNLTLWGYRLQSPLKDKLDDTVELETRVRILGQAGIFLFKLVLMTWERPILKPTFHNKTHYVKFKVLAPPHYPISDF